MQPRSSFKYLLAVLCWALVTAATAQATFQATLSKAVIGTGGTTQLNLVVSNATSVDYITPPSLSDFVVLSGPVKQQGRKKVNGSTQPFIGITYQLKSIAPGVFTIGAASAKSGGTILTSKALQLVVNSQPTQSITLGTPSIGSPSETATDPALTELVLKTGESALDKISKNMLLRAVASKTSCYVGESILVTYKLYTRLKSESNIVKSPAYNGFSVIDLISGMSDQYEVEKLDGREYNVYTLRKSQLYPLQAGITELEPAIVDNQVRLVKEAYASLLSKTLDAFGDPVLSALPADALLNEQITLESKPIMITVKPLPEMGRPSNFNGSTGKLTIQSAVESRQLSTDDAGKMRIVLQGTANFPLLNAPEFKWPAGIEGFEPTTRESISRFTAPVSGSKVFDYSFTIAKPGTYTIPPITYSYFDAEAEKYKTITTDSIVINVVKGTGKKTPLPPEEMTSTREAVADTIFTNRWMIIAPIAILIFAGLFFWLRADHKNEQLVAAVNRRNELQEKEVAIQQALQQNRFATAERAMLRNDAAEFYQALNRELHRLLSDQLNLPAESLNRKNIAVALDEKGISNSDHIAILRLLDDILTQLYMPQHNDDNMHHFYEQALQVNTILNNIA